ncbi:MAG TPA: type II toxin-antitoxin system VapC family toxin [Terracidiphilus sp.]|nr:type II toxin-antitoxin system VapC family toxin [Terracidiphilus sp.]
MAFVLDACVCAAWALADESSAIADRSALQLMKEIARVPTVWWYEVRNLLVVNERRQRLTEADTAVFLDLLTGYPIEMDSEPDEELTLRLARQHRLSFYDAAYLSLAVREHLPLATLDKALQSAAAAEGVALLG